MSAPNTEREILETCPEDGGNLSWDNDWNEWCCGTCGAGYDDREVRPQLHVPPRKRADA